LTGTASALKKILHASEQERADVAEARQRWTEDQPSLDPARLVFIDETGTSTNMTRLRGRARRGVRLVGRVPHGHWKITTFVAGLRCGAITAPFVIDRPMNGVIFRTYLERCLIPTLTPGDIVIMDNLSSHKVAGVREAIEAAGARLVSPRPAAELRPRGALHSRSRDARAVRSSPATPAATCSGRSRPVGASSPSARSSWASRRSSTGSRATRRSSRAAPR